MVNNYGVISYMNLVFLMFPLLKIISHLYSPSLTPMQFSGLVLVAWLFFFMLSYNFYQYLKTKKDGRNE